MYWPGGEQYKGSWKNNKRHGKGALVYKNGTKYEGDWEEGMRHGMGSMWTFQDGKFKVTYNGQWSHDVPCVRLPTPACVHACVSQNSKAA